MLAGQVNFAMLIVFLSRPLSRKSRIFSKAFIYPSIFKNLIIHIIIYWIRKSNKSLENHFNSMLISDNKMGGLHKNYIVKMFVYCMSLWGTILSSFKAIQYSYI